MSELVTLAKKVEEAEGPDRALDVLIWQAITAVGRHVENFFNRLTGEVELREEGPNGEPFELVPFYTASIDAGLTLVPDGEDWFVAKHHKGPGYASAVGGKTQKTCSAATPALALCAAALRARAAAQSDGEARDAE